MNSFLPFVEQFALLMRYCRTKPNLPLVEFPAGNGGALEAKKTISESNN
jgi:hypothetical protein